MGRKNKNASDDRPLGNTTTTDLEFSVVPFAEGASREAFTATVARDGCYMGYTGGSKLVLKTFKPTYYNEGLRVSVEDVYMQERVKALADDFNRTAGFRKNGSDCNIYVRLAKLDKFDRDYKRKGNTIFVKGEQFLLEQMINGTFQKFSSNSGWSCGDDMMDAFSHWTWAETHSVLVCDLQGVRGGDGEPRFGGGHEKYYYLITDPAIHSSDKRYGVSDLGFAGIEHFFFHHKCNHLCKALEISGDRVRGVDRFAVKRESSYDSLLNHQVNKLVKQLSSLQSSLAALIEEEEYTESSDSSDSEPETLQLRPKHIHFTHDSISKKFSCGRFIEDTLEEILDRETRVSEVPRIIVTKQDGKWWTFTGNRRLWVFRKLEAANFLQKVWVEVTDRPVPRKFMTTKNGGTSVRVRY
eukprot:TRINITY_DN115580_c0_g1_i1.p1 TRINITY_DN115580_c0_g1~~TRINITY_DN115580_c0_g1_i1.p1  ORF type:complete len:411 (+),score=42.32 TRINITY_DN115580_c0_g1_i1:85-1317(+)